MAVSSALWSALNAPGQQRRLATRATKGVPKKRAVKFIDSISGCEVYHWRPANMPETHTIAVRSGADPPD
ncbi:MAG: hypothetical protein DMG51_16775 [Acidobacteria bacterium]|nr:MAG: hypothetical protein DMG51_16775 [Acidobacteriota bacterium]